jgi:predicted nucleotidyltransferase
MNLHDLVAQQELSPDLIAHIDELLVLKSKAKEIGRGQRIAMIDDFIQEQMSWASVVAKKEERPDLMAEGNDLFRWIIKGGRS